MSKSADAFRTISEVAAELGIPKHVLRFWEARFSHIRPMKRGGGRRFYRPEDVDLLRGINILLHEEKYSIKGVQRIFREQGVEVVKHWGRTGKAPSEVLEVKSRAKKGRAKAGRPRASEEKSAPPVVRGGRPAADIQRAVRTAIAELEVCRDILMGRQPVAAPRRQSPANR
jgi:DNA-binding transcriptional MerR regulator